MAAEFHVGDIGTALRCTVRDENNAVVDLSTATVLQIKLLKPDREEVIHTGALYTDGTDGILQYVTTSADDLDQVGIWKLQGIVTFSASDTHKSNIKSFLVEPNI